MPIGLKDGIDIGSKIVGAGMALFQNQKKQDKRQLEQQGKLTQQQEESNRRMMDAKRAMDMKMWEDTNYSAQIEQARKAGMSISAMYGGSGASGATTTGGAPTVTGGQAADAGSATNAESNRLSNAMQMALIGAQTEKIKAETKNLESGVPVNETKATGQGIDNKVNEATSKDRIDMANWNEEKAFEDWTIRQTERQIQNATKQEQIDAIKADAAGKVLENVLTKSKTNLTEEQKKAVTKSIWKMEQDIRQGDEGLAIQKFKEEMQAAYPELGKVFGRTIDDTIQLIFGLAGKNRDQQRDQKKRVN